MREELVRKEFAVHLVHLVQVVDVAERDVHVLAVLERAAALDEPVEERPVAHLLEDRRLDLLYDELPVDGQASDGRAAAVHGAWYVRFLRADLHHLAEADVGEAPIRLALLFTPRGPRALYHGRQGARQRPE